MRERERALDDDSDCSVKKRVQKEKKKEILRCGLPTFSTLKCISQNTFHLL